MEKEYPAVLNTKEDYEFVRNNFPREYWEKDFEELLSEGYHYFVSGIIPDDWFGKTQVDGDELKRVLKPVSEKRANTVLAHQDEWEAKEIDFEVTHVRWNGNVYLVTFVPDPNAKILKIGYTVDELVDILYPIDGTDLHIDDELKDVNIDDLTDDEVMEVFNKMYNKGEKNDGSESEDQSGS